MSRSAEIERHHDNATISHKYSVDDKQSRFSLSKSMMRNITLPRVLLSVAICAVALAVARPARSQAFCNRHGSVTLVYQSNLNGSDDGNHASALVIGAVPSNEAASACQSLIERLLPVSAVQNYSSDFVDSLVYLDWKYSIGQMFTVDNAVLTVSNGALAFSTISSGGRPLPALCTQSSLANRPQNSSASPQSTLTVPGGNGTDYIGYRNAKSFRFNGIRYADPPKRFEYSTLYSGESETINATSYGSSCLQSGGSVGSEDCLFLNIQTPYLPHAGEPVPQSQHNLRPVFVWIHGGGFTGGTGADPGTDGGNLAAREDIVVVTINYRLSTLGFLAIPDTDITGNYGIGDQLNALRWVQQNIAYFGGDPSRVTIGGSSAGAGSVRALLGSPPAIQENLFAGAMLDSNLGGGITLGLDGNYGTTYSDYLTIAESYNRTGVPLLNATNCLSSTANSSTTTQADCLRTANASILITGNDVARYVVQDSTIINTAYLTVASGPNSSTAAHVPLMLGVAANDGASFSTLSPSPVSNLSQGLQIGLDITAPNAQRIIDSNLFPFYDTGNLTLDAFNVTQRVATDSTFRCVDQATAYAGSKTNTFPSVWYYQFNRARAGYNPNNLSQALTDGPVVSGEYPEGDPRSAAYFRLHGGTGPWLFGNWEGEFRDEGDLYSMQLVSGYVGQFVRTGQPNLDVAWLGIRGEAYAGTLRAVREFGVWEEGNGQMPVRVFDWPAKSEGWVDVEQCGWLGYGLEYYLR